MLISFKTSNAKTPKICLPDKIVVRYAERGREGSVELFLLLCLRVEAEGEVRFQSVAVVGGGAEGLDCLFDG